MAELAELEVTVGEIVKHIRMTGVFASALREVVQRKVTRAAAEEAGLTVSDEELQSAADGFRVANGLNKADQTQAWLAAAGVDVETLENWLETNLLISKFRDKLEAEADKAAYVATPAVQETIRRLVYQDWLAKTIGGAE